MKLAAPFFFFFLLIQQFCFAEADVRQGGNIALVVSYGSHQKRIGLVMQKYVVSNFLQFNPSVRVYYNFTNLGPKQKCWEMLASMGAVVGFGNKYNPLVSDEFLSNVANFTQYKNSVVYSYNWYRNDIGTSQVTAVCGLQSGYWQVLMENDMIAAPYLDRFRTGAFLLQYATKDYQIALNSTMWTGESRVRVTDTKYPSRHGYRQMTNEQFGNCSSGILALQVKVKSNYHQVWQGSVGVDADQVRHFIQNKLIHDMFFLPKQFSNKVNAHFPMLQPDGSPYLFLPGQKIRKPKFYGQLCLNPSLFY